MSDECSFTLDPDRWRERTGDDSSLTEPWSCPHGSHGDAEYCPFHLPPERRREVGLDGEAVADALVDRVAEGDPAAKRFVGARFDDLDLGYRVVASPDNHPIDLRHATVDGTLRLANATLDDAVDLRHAEAVALEGEDAAFEGDCALAGAAFDRLDLTGATVDGDVDAPGLTVEGAASFDEARFDGDVDLGGVRFGATASFRGTEFRGDANHHQDDVSFAGARFAADAAFTRAEFERADFEAATVGGEASFEEVRFGGDATFDGVAFDGPARFRGAEFRGGDNAAAEDLTFAGATFAADADFRRAQFRYATFAGARFEGEAAFAEASFRREADFDGAAFAGEALFTEGRFHHDTSFANAAFAAPATFRGCEFHGGDNVDDDDLTFAGATFAADADFYRAEFALATFAETTFEGPADFAECSFDRAAAFVGAAFEEVARFRGVRFDGTLSFEDAAFGDRAVFTESRFDHDAQFVGTAFGGPTVFRGSEFHGGEHTVDDADFEGATFAAEADFSLVEFRSASFEDVLAEADLRLTDARFAETARLDGLTVRGAADFEHARFEQYAVFSGATFEGEACFDQIRFAEETSFEDATFAADALFRATEFRGDANLHDDDATFAGATFHGTADFEHARFQYANFVDVTFHGSARFGNARFHERVELRAVPGDGVGLVDVSGGLLAGGRIEQPDDGTMYYDLTRATVGELLLADGGEGELFDRFRICNTVFENFDFTHHKASLARNNWVIHEWGAAGLDRFPDVEPVTDPAVLESTYLKAKNSAAAFGDRKAAAEFFIKEMTYRRYKNGRIALDRGDGADASVRNRLKAAGKWFGNGVLYETCGYGERLWRVVYVSAVAVFLWGFLYATMTEGTEGASGLTNEGLDSVADLASPEGVVVLGKNLYFSMVTFTTLGYGDIQPVGVTARTLAGLESFFGALLVALVVFVLGRRVAW